MDRPPPASDPPGLVRPPRRPAGWVAPGPPPRTPPHRPDLAPGPGEDLCALAGDWRILQRRRGHRWSLDDLVTAWFAATLLETPPRQVIDLGCGIGTVLLLLAWRFPAARLLGVEAQAVSAAMAERSAAWNGADDRCTVRAGDFRDPAVLADLPPADLITGTPPYLPPGAGTESEREQCGPCRFEHRGGVGDYLRAAAPRLAPQAPFAGCAAARQRAAVQAGAEAAGLGLAVWREVIPREGKAPLLAVFAARQGAGPTLVPPPLVVRDAAGRWTPGFAAVRRDMGMPPPPGDDAAAGRIDLEAQTP